MTEENQGIVRPGASYEDILRMQKQNEARKHRRDHPAHGTVIHGHINLGEADREERQRQSQHPTSGSTDEIPDRWTSTGQRPQQPGH